MHSLTSLFALALLPAAALAAPAPAKQQEAVRLVGRAPSPVNADNVQQALTTALERLSKRSEEAEEVQLEKRGYRVPIKNNIDDQGFASTIATVQVGTPAQDVGVMFDTGSADFFIPVTCGENCAAGFLDTSKSSTFRNKTVEYTIEYAGGAQATGNLATDTVTVGGLTVPQQSFLAVTRQVLDPEHLPKFAGVFGLGYHGPSNIGATSFLDNLLATKKLVGNRFSLYFSRSTDGSELVLGGVDSTKYEGSFTTLNALKGQGPHWALEGWGYRADDQLVSRGPRTTTYVDSGSSIIVIPKAAAAAIYRKIPEAASFPYQYSIGGKLVDIDIYYFPCDAAAVSVGFQIKSEGRLQTVTMDKQDLIAYEDSGYCFGTVYGADYSVSGSGAIALLGTPFLRSQYSVFSFGDDGNTPTISFAKSK